MTLGLIFAQSNFMKNRLNFLSNVPILLKGIFGKKVIRVREFQDFKPGLVLELDKLAGEPIDLYMNGIYIARGEVIIVNERYGIRLTDIAKKNGVWSK